MRTFRNPANGHTEQFEDGAWFFIVLFGPFYLAYRGLWVHFFIWTILVGGLTGITGGPGLIIALPLATIVYGFTIGGILANSYLRRGWEEVADPASAVPGQVNVSTNGLRECPFCAELIKAQAVKCKHCGSEVEPVPVQAAEVLKPASTISARPWFITIPYSSNNEYRAIAEKVRELGHEVHSETSLYMRVGPYPTKDAAGEILRQFMANHDLHGNLEEAAAGYVPVPRWD
ncbi:hypothetical protein [Pseudomonas sp. BN606]|uniref:hypothetical protein n=1 Tax=Pseudomonas sp. BN606 TaxID=2567894 RepID=UPI0024574CC5|nr:hypothetical protein [Pseudomonas sp. BN606]MDH4656014.1 hypothetical protein [Pseudomonas sp. BN606]